MSVDPFVRPPYFSFSEKRTRDNLQFLTGAAGALQSVLYGFAGLSLQDSPTPVFRPQLPSLVGPRAPPLRLARQAVRRPLRRGQPAQITAR